MNLNTYLKNKLEQLSELEDNLAEPSKTLTSYIEEERKICLGIQLLLMKSLDQQYSCHGITYIPDMYNYYNFDIVVTPRSIKNDHFTD